MSFRVLVCCRDCSDGQDPLGCFDGADEYLYSNKPPYDIKEFSTVEEAELAGVEETKKYYMGI